MTRTAFIALAATLLTASLAAAQPRGREHDRRGPQRDSHREFRGGDRDHFRGHVIRRDDHRRGHSFHRDRRPRVVIVRPPVRRYHWPSSHFRSGLFFNLHID